MLRSGILTTLSLLMISGCMNATAERSSELSTGSHDTGDDVSVQFTIEDTTGENRHAFQIGETLRFVFAVVNNTNEARRLDYTFPPHRVEVVDAKNDQPVWQAWQGQMFPQVMREKSVPAGESVTFTVEWDTANVSSGQYQVRPRFHGFMQSKSLESELPAVSISLEQ